METPQRKPDGLVVMQFLRAWTPSEIYNKLPEVRRVGFIPGVTGNGAWIPMSIFSDTSGFPIKVTPPSVGRSVKFSPILYILLHV